MYVLINTLMYDMYSYDWWYVEIFYVLFLF